MKKPKPKKPYVPGDKPKGTDYTYALQWVAYAKKLEARLEVLRKQYAKGRIPNTPISHFKFFVPVKFRLNS